MDARRKTSIRLSEDAREGFARVAAKPFGGKPAFGADEGDGGGSPIPGKSPGTPTKRDIPKDHEFDKKAVKPIVQTLWAMSVALGHALTAHRSFSRLKSSTFSPDGLLGGRGYVLPVKDVRSDLFEACEKLSALCDTLHDEINAPHWKPKIAELEKADMDEVERLLGDSEDWIDNPEGEADDEEGEVEKKPWSKPKKDRFEKDHDNFKSNLPDGGDAETVPSQGPHPAGRDHPQNRQNKQASVHTALDPSILGLSPGDIAEMDKEEKEDACINSLMRAADLAEQTVRAFQDVLSPVDRSSVLHGMTGIRQVGRKMIHTKTAGETAETVVTYNYNRPFTNATVPTEVYCARTVEELSLQVEASLAGVKDDHDLVVALFERRANSSLAPQTEPGGPRVQHLDRADTDQDGPEGSYNRDEKPVADQWAEEGGVSGEPMSQDSGYSYIYPSDWSGDTSSKNAGSSVPDSNTDRTPTQGWDFGVGYGTGDDAHGQGAGGYGQGNPGSPGENGNRGVYGPEAELPNDPGGKTHDNEESDTTPTIEKSVSESGHMGLPVNAAYEVVPDQNGVLVAVDHAELPNDTDDPVARSDYFRGDKGNDYNGILHRAAEGAAELPGGSTPQTEAPLKARPSHLGEHEFAAAGELPGDESSDLYDYGKGGGGGNIMDQVEQGNQPYVKWDDETHNMRPDYNYQRDPIQGPYPHQGV